MFMNSVSVVLYIIGKQNIKLWKIILFSKTICFNCSEAGMPMQAEEIRLYIISFRQSQLHYK